MHEAKVFRPKYENMYAPKVRRKTSFPVPACRLSSAINIPPFPEVLRDDPARAAERTRGVRKNYDKKDRKIKTAGRTGGTAAEKENRMNKYLESIAAGRIIVAGHRGAKSCRPENTMPSFAAAVEAGVDCIETDIHQTADGKLVLMHDGKVDRTTDSRGLIREMTLEQIKSLDAGSWFSEEYAGTRVPTLGELLEFAKPHRDLLLNLELKDYPRDVGEMAYVTADKVIAAVESAGLADRVMINSFSWQILKYVHDRYGDRYPLHGFHPGFIMQSPEEDIFPILTYVCMFNCVRREDGSVNWSPDKSREERRRDFEDVKKVLGCEPCVCGWESPETMQTGIEYGVSMFTCNDPAKAIGVLKELGAR
jgi:glycerophosphoryl diester phosphodiesterase